MNTQAKNKIVTIKVKRDTLKNSLLESFYTKTNQIELLKKELKELEKTIIDSLNNGAIVGKTSKYNAYIKKTVKNSVAYKDLLIKHVKDHEKIINDAKTPSTSFKLNVDLK